MYDKLRRQIVRGDTLDTLFADQTFDFVLLKIERGELGAIAGGY
jgi:predicted O-methyltransferase YrrM